MSLVTLADYKTALKVNEITEDAKLTQYSLEIDQRVKSYLGFGVEQTEYTDEIYSGNGKHYLFPKNIPVTTITSLYVYMGLDSDGDEDCEEWTQNDEYSRLIIEQNGFIIYIDGAVFPNGSNNIKLTYTAGYTSGTLPQDIQAVCKELMIIKYLGIDKQNLGRPSVSLGIGSNATASFDLDEDKVLKKIEHYKLQRI